MRSSLHSFFVGVTDIGDSACLIALCCAASIYLLYRGSSRAAGFLVASLGISALLIGSLKLAFLGCHARFSFLDIHSPSGHAATSAAVFWACSLLMRSQLETNRRFLPLALMTLLVALIAVSRVELELHSVAEVCIGLIVGVISVMLARFLVLRNRGLVPFDAYVFALWCIVAVFFLHGVHLPIEHWLREIASHIRGHIPYCGSS